MKQSRHVGMPLSDLLMRKLYQWSLNILITRTTLCVTMLWICNNTCVIIHTLSVTKVTSYEHSKIYINIEFFKKIFKRNVLQVLGLPVFQMIVHLYLPNGDPLIQTAWISMSSMAPRPCCWTWGQRKLWYW